MSGEPKKTILVIGTYDTKSDELGYLASCIERQGGAVLSMDVSVLGEPRAAVDVSKHDVASAAGSSIAEAAAAGDESRAMQIMARGAAALARRLYDEHRIDGMIAIGGTMGTDLALECARALPIGVPKYVVSTVAFSPLIPAERLSPDIQMILWAGGLYGLNAICRSSLSQAAGAVLGAARAAVPPRACWPAVRLGGGGGRGAARAAVPPRADRPVVGMTSLGSSCLSYMRSLKPALEQRGFEVAVFHATGMGGMAYESIAAESGFAAVMDFALPELGNLMFGSVVHAGSERLLSAGRAGIPQLVAPGCIDLIDFAGWQEVPPRFADRPVHEHNRLIKSAAFDAGERRETAREIGRRLQRAAGPVQVLLPLRGIEEWDKAGGPAHDPEGLAAFLDEMRKSIRPPATLVEVDAHINDAQFSDKVLEIFDAWVADGSIRL